MTCQVPRPRIPPAPALYLHVGRPTLRPSGPVHSRSGRGKERGEEPVARLDPGQRHPKSRAPSIPRAAARTSSAGRPTLARSPDPIHSPPRWTENRGRCRPPRWPAAGGILSSPDSQHPSRGHAGPNLRVNRPQAGPRPVRPARCRLPTHSRFGLSVNPAVRGHRRSSTALHPPHRHRARPSSAPHTPRNRARVPAALARPSPGAAGRHRSPRHPRRGRPYRVGGQRR
jgi:hypothetical protein